MKFFIPGCWAIGGPFSSIFPPQMIKYCRRFIVSSVPKPQWPKYCNFTTVFLTVAITSSKQHCHRLTKGTKGMFAESCRFLCVLFKIFVKYWVWIWVLESGHYIVLIIKFLQTFRFENITIRA